MIKALGSWEPDSAGVDSGVLLIAKNVYVNKAGYAPIPDLASYATNSLPSTCLGMAFARVAAGGWVVFAGTRTKLYKLVSLTWTDYTRTVGGDYNVPNDNYWSFAQFGSQLIAVNSTDDVQVIDVDSGATSFSALGGSPPKARYVAVVGDFVVLAGLASNLRKVRNSAINDATGWTVGTDLCDEQEFADGGRVTGIAGGEFGYVTQEKSIRRMIFQPGSDFAFRYERVEQERGCSAGYGLVSAGNRIFFPSDDGFYSFGPEGLTAIGADRVNDWFREESEISKFFATIAFTDPYGPRVCWAFFGDGDSEAAHFDRLLIYDWKLDRWSHAEVTAQYWATFATPGTTLEALDVYGDIDGGGIPFPFDSRVWEGGRPVIGAIVADGSLSFLEADTPLTATLTTCKMHVNPEGRAKVISVEPRGRFNGATVAGRIGKEEYEGATQTFTSSTSRSSRTGKLNSIASGRLHQFEFTLTQSSGTVWTHMQGFRVDAVPDGM